MTLWCVRSDPRLLLNCRCLFSVSHSSLKVADTKEAMMADDATLLRDHVTLTCRSVDRIFLQAYVPKLQSVVGQLLRVECGHDGPSADGGQAERDVGFTRQSRSDGEGFKPVGIDAADERRIDDQPDRKYGQLLGHGPVQPTRCIARRSPFAVTRTAPRGSVCTVMVNAAPAQSLPLCQTACAPQRPYWGRTGIVGPDG
jgi:hypothetical protein